MKNEPYVVGDTLNIDGVELLAVSETNGCDGCYLQYRGCQGIRCSNNYVIFVKNEITPVEMVPITFDNYRRLHDIACGTWKERLTEWHSDIFKSIFDKSGIISTVKIRMMLKAATSEQKPIVEEIFSDYLNPKTVNIFTERISNELERKIYDESNKCLMVGDIFAQQAGRSDLAHKCLYANDKVKVKLTNYNGGTIIEFIKK